MTTGQNTTEGISNGTTVTNLNSGGLSGDAWDATQVGASAALISDNTHAAHGAQATRFSTGASSVQVNVTRTLSAAATYWARLSIFTPSSFSLNPTLIRMRSTGGTVDVGRIRISSAGNIQILNTAASVVATSTTTLSTGTFYRIECFFTQGASSTAEVKIFTNVNDPLPAAAETLNIGAQNFGTANIDSIQFGQIVAVINLPNWWGDDFGYSNVAYMGPFLNITPGPSQVAGFGSFSPPLIWVSRSPLVSTVLPTQPVRVQLPPPPPYPSLQIVRRAHLQDDPQLVPTKPVIAPYVPPKPPVGPILALRAHLQDNPQLVPTRAIIAPYVPPKPPVGPILTLRAHLQDNPQLVPTAAVIAPYVPPKPPVGPILALRAHLQDNPQLVPTKAIVSLAAPLPPAGGLVIIRRGSLVDPPPPPTTLPAQPVVRTAIAPAVQPSLILTRRAHLQDNLQLTPTRPVIVQSTIVPQQPNLVLTQRSPLVDARSGTTAVVVGTRQTATPFSPPLIISSHAPVVFMAGAPAPVIVQAQPSVVLAPMIAVLRAPLLPQGGFFNILLPPIGSAEYFWPMVVGIIHDPGGPCLQDLEHDCDGVQIEGGP